MSFRALILRLGLQTRLVNMQSWSAKLTASAEAPVSLIGG